MLEDVELFGLEDRPAPLLSGGQQQRVAIARALVNEPSIILADEPTANLDFKTGADIINILKELSLTHGVTIITATHDHKMLKNSDRVLWIRDGGVDHIDNRDDLHIDEGAISSLGDTEELDDLMQDEQSSKKPSEESSSN